MLRAIPKGWLAKKFELFDNDDFIGTIRMTFNESSDMSVEGREYKTYREGWVSGRFLLEAEDGEIIASAEKPDAFHRSFQVSFDGGQFTLEAESAFYRKFVLIDDRGVVGSVYPDGAWTRRATIDLPADIPCPVRAFMFWLVAILWKRASDSAAASAT